MLSRSLILHEPIYSAWLMVYGIGCKRYFTGSVLYNNSNNKWHLYSALFSKIAALRRFTILLSLTQTCFHPAYISTPKGAYNACCHYRHKALLRHTTITSCPILIFLWMSEPVAIWRHCNSRSLKPATIWLRVLCSN